MKPERTMNKNHTDTILEEVSREEESHGGRWDKIHGGYFSSADVAAPFIAEIADAVEQSNPDVAVDLGGGTGFILRSLADAVPDREMKMIDLDLSPEQLDNLTQSDIISKQGSIISFERKELADPGKTFLYLSRSTFHYAGESGLAPLIQHIRQQMHKDEFLIHQTACFENAGDASILNTVYSMMNSDKWYPTQQKLCDTLSRAGFEVIKVSKTSPLTLTSEELMSRYQLSPEQIKKIIEAVNNKLNGQEEGVFESTTDGFTAYLHYSIFSCRAL